MHVLNPVQISNALLYFNFSFFINKSKFFIKVSESGPIKTTFLTNRGGASLNIFDY